MAPRKSPIFHPWFLRECYAKWMRRWIINTARNAICLLGLHIFYRNWGRLTLTSTHMLGRCDQTYNGENLWEASSQQTETLDLWNRQLATVLFVEVDIGWHLSYKRNLQRHFMTQLDALQDQYLCQIQTLYQASQVLCGYITYQESNSLQHEMKYINIYLHIYITPLI